MASGTFGTSAAAHTSQWCGHSTLTGKYNRLVYETYENVEINRHKYEHYHAVEH